MQELLERPGGMAHEIRENDEALKAALWIVDALAQELAQGDAHDRRALLAALRRRAGYEQADAPWAGAAEIRRAELVARLAGRVARD